MKSVMVGVVTALVTAAIFSGLGYIGKLPFTLGVPKGSIVAFQAKECPPEGWSEYTPAYGKFLRGIDKSGAGIDPGGIRAPGISQSDAIASHVHGIRPVHHTSHAPSNLKGHGYQHGDHGGGVSSTEENRGSEPETRPKNVAVLFCVKG